MSHIENSTPSQVATDVSPTPYLLRHVAIVFCGFLAVGAPLAALPLFVHDTLGFGPTTAGTMVALQSFATILTRHRAGAFVDRRDPRTAILLGLPCAAFAACFYLVAALAPLADAGRLAVLVPGRLLMGLAESLFLTGTMSLGIATLGPARTGLVMSWQGIAMYAAFGLGAPLGLTVHAVAGFAGVAVLAIAMPLVVLPLAVAFPHVATKGGGGGGKDDVPFYRVIALIWRQGLVLTLGAIPFAAMATFLVLDYSARGWTHAGAGLAAFGACYILVRLFGSHWPDRYGGARIAGWSLVVETVGQLCMCLAPVESVSLVGAALSGLGFSLVFPAMGVDATRRVPPEMRGRAVGNFIAFFDIALGMTGPLAGLLVAPFGFSSVFCLGTAACLIAVVILVASGPEKAAGPKALA